MNRGPLLIRRLGRAVLWQRPAFYRWFGQVRGRGDCFAQDFDLWIDGFPRSSNTFAVEAFQLANPTARVRSHRHIPPFIIQALTLNKPGIFLIRKPEDAVVSWAIFWNARVEDCLNYYIDFHRVLRPYASQFFVASFSEVTNQFGTVIEQFNRRFGTQYLSLPNDPGTVSECFSRIEQSQGAPEGNVNELRICRPSRQRSELKPELIKQLRTSPGLVRKLERANELFATFSPVSGRLRANVKKPGNTQALPMVS